TELGPEDSRVKANLPMHGANLFPPQLPEMRATVLAYMDALTQLGQHLLRGISLSLGLAEDYFLQHFTADPLCLFRIFHYPSFGERQVEAGQWGVGEHTDYGLLTILKQDSVGGLQVKTPDGWIEAPYLPNTFVCNIGDMLDRMTGGYYRSTPHRVRNLSGRSRYSYPFFFDPGFAAEIKSVPVEKAVGNAPERWDGADLQAVQGTYGDYILNKVSKVFPDLHHDQL
ncbi:MAG: 2OG-Fe(II) oxygenase family protein, partial [Bacteroidota bacterium]